MRQSGDIGCVAEKLNGQAYHSGECDGKRFARKNGRGKYAQRIYSKESYEKMRAYCLHHFGGFTQVSDGIKEQWRCGFDKGWLEASYESHEVS